MSESQSSYPGAGSVNYSNIFESVFGGVDACGRAAAAGQDVEQNSHPFSAAIPVIFCAAGMSEWPRHFIRKIARHKPPRIHCEFAVAHPVTILCLLCGNMSTTSKLTSSSSPVTGAKKPFPSTSRKVAAPVRPRNAAAYRKRARSSCPAQRGTRPCGVYCSEPRPKSVFPAQNKSSQRKKNRDALYCVPIFNVIKFRRIRPP